ncbi:MAG: hypothetical protein AABZ31_14875 [Bdellovibrionota bacterium]
MKLKILLLAFSTLMMVSISQAKEGEGGSSVGDGGHSVVCKKDGKISSVNFLDIVEIKKLFSGSLRLMCPSNLPGIDYWASNREGRWYNACLNAHIYRFRKVAKNILGSKHPFMKVFDLADDIAIRMEPLVREQLLNSDTHLPQLISLKPRCTIQQVALFDYTGSELKLLIYEPLFKKMSIYHQSALITHEAIHTWFQNPTSTLTTRQAIWYLGGNQSFKVKNHEAFIRLINEKTPQIFVRD